MRSGIIIAWPKEGKPPAVKYFERYQDAREESASLREDKVKHELWSSDGGRERKVHGGKSCINWDAAKHIPSESQKLAWANKAEAQANAEQEKKIADATDPNKKTASPEAGKQPDSDEAKETEIDETTE